MKASKVKSIVLSYIKSPDKLKSTKKLDRLVDQEDFMDDFKNLIYINYLIDFTLIKINNEKAKQKILSKIERSSKHDFWIYNIKIAASILLFASLSLYTYNNFYSNNKKVAFSSDIVQLKMPDGELVSLQNSNYTKLYTKNGNYIAQQQGNVLIFDSNSSFNIQQYQLHVPNAHKFSITLSDGTKITLNSGTKIEFSNNFISSNTRQVYLEGEAYFEVTPDPKVPFIVKCANSEIKVLGTTFNVEAYADENTTNTYLLKGSVVLRPLIDLKSVSYSIKLNPGEGVRWNKVEKELNHYKSDGKQFFSWLDGKLVFKHLTFKEIKTKLQRHYNVKIINKDPTLDDLQITASFDTQNLREVLENIKEIYPFTYTIVGNLVTIEREMITTN